MKKILSLLFACLAFAGMTSCQKTELSVISFNIRQGVANDGENSWELRRPATAAMLKEQAPDIFGLQEAFDFQIDFIKEALPEYECFGVGRDDGKNAGEHMSIFYNTNTVKMMDSGTFWLSETPEVPSMGWDAACRRTATWALLEKEGKKFYYVNTHLDHVGKEAQMKGLALIVDRIAEINPDGFPMVLTGDFNVTPDDSVLDELKTKMLSARDTAAQTDNHFTYNGWGNSESVIDYIWYSGFAECPEFRTITEEYAGIPYISDHFPVLARLVF